MNAAATAVGSRTLRRRHSSAAPWLAARPSPGSPRCRASRGLACGRARLWTGQGPTRLLLTTTQPLQCVRCGTGSPPAKRCMSGWNITGVTCERGSACLVSGRFGRHACCALCCAVLLDGRSTRDQPRRTCRHSAQRTFCGDSTLKRTRPTLASVGSGRRAETNTGT